MAGRTKRYLNDEAGNICRVRAGGTSRVFFPVCFDPGDGVMAMEFWTRLQQFGVVRLAIIIGASLGVAAILGFVALRPPSGDYGVLYANLDYANGQSVIDRLEADNTPYRLREAGGRVTILAPRGVIAPLRIDLAADGVITASGVGYEIFDETDALGATAFQQNINRLRALEGELARTIASIAGVRSARVHLVLPERALFARERTPASASIMVEAPAGLEPRAVRAITNLVASAVPELTAGQVTVLDASGALLSAAQDENGVFLNSIEEKTAATQTRLRRTVEDIVGRIVGPDNVRVQVAAELDLNRVTENAEIIDPDSQTVLSETVASNTGIGNVMMTASSNFQVSLVFAGLIILALMGVALYAVFSLLERRVTGWATRGNDLAVT